MLNISRTFHKFFLVLFLFFSLLFVLFSCNILAKLIRFNKANLKSYTNSIGIEFIAIPAGDFDMGCSSEDSSCDEDEKPDHQVEITKSFLLSKTEITNYQFEKFIQSTDYKTDAEKKQSTDTWKDCFGIKPKPKYPVICVSWNDAKAFTRWLCEQEKRTYRLPTEAEWEYSARAGLFTKYYWGPDFDEQYVWYNKNSSNSINIVATKEANHWGLYDILGNVWEWCEDGYDKDFYKKKIKKDPQNKSLGKGRVLRGGSWFDPDIMLRVSTRSFAPPEMRENNIGFRILLEK